MESLIAREIGDGAVRPLTKDSLGAPAREIPMVDAHNNPVMDTSVDPPKQKMRQIPAIPPTKIGGAGSGALIRPGTPA